MNTKINTKIEFPQFLDIEAYTLEGVEKKEQKKLHEQ